MRGRIIRTLSAAATAGVTTLAFTAGAADAASAAPGGRAAQLIARPSGGRAIYSTANCFGFGGPLLRQTSDSPGIPPCALSGYQASGRDFRFVEALITVPRHAGNTSADPMVYVALDGSTSGSTDYARAGIEPGAASPGAASPSDGSPGGWDAFVEVQEPALAPVFVTRTIPRKFGGHAIFFSIYLNAAGDSLHFVTALPNGTTFSNTVAVNGPVYTAAQALADWSDTDASPIPVTPAANTRLTQFRQGQFTTVGGAQGTFAGPWTLNPVEVTSNGAASPQEISAPSYLWTSANSLNGRPGDAFGVWLYR
jgi:hypothetical protein